MLLKRKEFCVRSFRNKGSILITLIITMLIFSVLAAAMLSLTGTSLFSQLNTSSTTRATYIAKSGYNYLASVYKNATTEALRNSALETLQGITYQLLNNNGSFILNVKPYYLRYQGAAAYTINNNNGLTLLVKFPGAVTYTIPSSATDKAMAVYTTAGYRRFYYTTVTGVSPNFTLNLSNTNPPDGQPFTVAVGESIVPVLTLAPAIQTLTNGGNFTVAAGTGAIFPARFGFFEIPLADTTGHVYYYDHRTADTFYGLYDANRPARTFSYTTTALTGFIYAHTAAQINSTGTFNPGGSFTTSNTFSRMAILGYTPGGNSDNATPYSITGTGGFISVGTGVTPSANTIVLGGGATDTRGVAWYAGNSDAAYCVNGICNFSYGIRAYFTFADSAAGARGDGFTFTIMNGSNNDISKRGGIPTGTGLGELMGYGGPGNTITGAAAPLANPPLDGLGLEPPKMAIEFDKYTNAGVSVPAGCTNGRNDTANNHMALMFWGDNPVSTVLCGTGLPPAASYDDNVHGAGIWGSNTVPSNSAVGDSTADGSRGYYESAGAWLNTTANHTFRIEVTRDKTINGNGNYNYNVKAWIDCTTCSDVSVQYNAATPQINRTIELSPALHAQFSTLLFGFTQSTGTATQNITISNFVIYFTPD